MSNLICLIKFTCPLQVFHITVSYRKTNHSKDLKKRGGGGRWWMMKYQQVVGNISPGDRERGCTRAAVASSAKGLYENSRAASGGEDVASCHSSNSGGSTAMPVGRYLSYLSRERLWRVLRPHRSHACANLFQTI